MTEDRNIKNNLREAIRQEELSHPPLPKDLNARLMKRVEKEVNGNKPGIRKRIVWPWIAAACVAAIIVVYLTPPKSPLTPELAEGQSRTIASPKGCVAQGGTSNSLVVSNPKIQETNGSEVKEQSPVIAETEREPQRKQVKKAMEVKSKETLYARAEVHEESSKSVEDVAIEEKATAHEPQLAATENPQTQQKPRVLTERDIPITRQENYKYTKEEIALMKKQANETYRKWVELELEIARYNQEQTAQQ